ncbi:MAG: aldo/keto reductase [Clostridia bacterium]
MRTMGLGSSGLQVPVVAVGCMRLRTLEPEAAERFLETALEQGGNFFDHADRYGNGASESLFARALHLGEPGGRRRDEVIIQSKCGIRDTMYDFSQEHILSAVEGSLRRLHTDYLDVLLLHRPDALMEPEEVAEAFSSLQHAGKVLHFGVSNMKPSQIDLLQRALPEPLVANQLQLSLTNATMIAHGINVNMENAAAVDRDGSVLDYCRLHDITIQPWSPFQYGFFDGVFIGSDRYPELNRVLERVAGDHGVTATTIAVAWLLRHPARMQPVIGTMNPARLGQCLQAANVPLSRQEWYDLFVAAGNPLP